MPKKLLALVVAFCLFISVFFTAPVSQAIDTSSGNLDTITKQLADLNDALNKSIAATKPLQSELDKMKKQIDDIKNEVAAIEAATQIKEKEIENGYEDLAEKEKIIEGTVRNYYIHNYYNTPLLIFLSADDASEMTQTLAYQRAKTRQDKTIITNIALSIVDLEEKKQQLEQQQRWLTATKADLDEKSAKLDEVVKGAVAYQSELSGKIAELSAQQQAIITARSGGFTFTLGDNGLADEYIASLEGFKAQAPGGYFAAFSFGAYTHRKGMSQYGARGRAQAGQNTNQILKAYYGKEPTNVNTDGDISVSGYGSMNFETTYLYGIAEMPSSWHPEALKAQAIAARTYAHRYKSEGKEICTTESCQVFNKGKSDNPPQAWKDAVDQTKGQILEGVTTYYASTHGGFADPIGWDTTDGSGGSTFIDKSYDKLGGSPWLYKSWWRQGYSTSGATCGRSNPWLSPEEMADIVNAALALRNGGLDTSRITPVTTSCWPGNPYSMNELRSLVSGSISSATSVSVTQGNGTTNTVVINGISFSGSEFKTAFNLRAPGYLSIPQSGFAFFNIERK
ncbi:MAG TPA: SpoIID/LytB domain-containing protein [Patescibacteria group bacterium]|nr:SpoIID/LytB domain-containing protein [Patescibacteria group bacterium]